METGPSFFALFAGVPVTCTFGSGAPTLLAGTIAYQCPDAVGSANVAADVAGTTVAPVPPSATAAAFPGHGLRTCSDPFDPASTIAKTTFPFLTCTSTFE